MKVRSDSSAARAMVQRQGIGRVRHLDASLLWVQQKEKEKVMNIAAIPTELNCADVGTKSLTKKRLFGLLYMMKMIDAIGERVGREEYKEIEHQYQIKKGTKKLMKGGKDLRVGLLLLMASLDTVAGEQMNHETEPNAYKFEWWALILCALIGALSVMQWLRCMVERFFENMFTKEKTNEVANEDENAKKQRSGHDQETQVIQRLDCSLWRKYEEQIKDLEDQKDDLQQELLRAEGTIEDLKVDLQMARVQREENFQMYQLVEKRSIKLEKKCLNFRKCGNGRVIHFEESCHTGRKESPSIFARCVRAKRPC